MRCHTQHPHLRNKPVQVHDLWEVLISSKLWAKIQDLAKKRKCSYTTITRYCAFRLAEKETLRWNRSFQKAHEIAETEQSTTTDVHRHMVCLYGEDVLMLRLAALRLALTVSAFLRLALQLFLPRFDADTDNRRCISALELFWRGIKRWKQIPLAALNHSGMPAIRRFAFSSFMPWEWWGEPTSEFS